MVFILIWLFLSYGFIFAIAGVLIHSGRITVAVVLLGFILALRLWNRFRSEKAYYLIGYIGRVGGEMASPSGFVGKRSNSIKFKFFLLLEFGVICFYTVFLIQKS